jgi:hypothetical protein
MSATNQFEDDLLDLIFTNVAAPNVGDAGGLQPSTAAGSFFVSLHTGSAIGEATTAQNSSEAAYTSYARQGVARSTAGWTVASGNVDNDNAVTFPQATGGSETETDFGLGFASTAAGYLSMYGALTSSLAVSSGITPEFAAGDIDVSLD